MRSVEKWFAAVILIAAFGGCDRVKASLEPKPPTITAPVLPPGLTK